MRVVLDTNVVISGLFWRGAAYRCLLAVEAGLFESISAEPLLAELRETLIAKFHIESDEADEVVAHVRRKAILVRIEGRSGWVADDPDDDKFVEAAIAGQADAIVSGDRHLLALGAVAGIRVLRVRELLGLLGA